jgi:hypothetical protein
VRNLRGLLAVLVALTYLLAGTLHRIHDFDVTNPSGQSEIVSVLGDSAGHPDQKALGDRHCHGCFSVAEPAPVQSAALAELAAAPDPAHQPMVAGVTPDTESPPPKHLT